MLTEEQIKNLKKGDKLIAEVTVEAIYIDKDIMCTSPFTSYTGGIHLGFQAFHTSCLSLPTAEPKYDPTRLFKKGDIVRLKEWNGRCPEMYSATNSWCNHPPRCKNGNLEVREDEKNSMVEIGIIDADCAQAAAAPCYLELVTPAEERDLYFVLDLPNTCNVCKRGESGFVATFYKKHPFARKKADEYCEALNEEIRKEQV